jgi:hypothetical protein
MKQGAGMQIEDLLDECLQIQASGGDPAPVLAQYPALRAEVEAILTLAQATRRLPRVELNPAARERMLYRLRHQMTEPDNLDVHVQAAPQGEDRFLHMLAGRLGATRDEIRRYLGPAGAAQFCQFLGLPGYSGMFVALGLMVRCLRTLERGGMAF